jgi:hypothetical protein
MEMKKPPAVKRPSTTDDAVNEAMRQLRVRRPPSELRPAAVVEPPRSERKRRAIDEAIASACKRSRLSARNSVVRGRETAFEAACDDIRTECEQMADVDMAATHAAKRVLATVSEMRRTHYIARRRLKAAAAQ